MSIIFLSESLRRTWRLQGWPLTHKSGLTFSLNQPWTWSGEKRERAMLGGWVNPHREHQTIPQGQTSSPPKSFFTPTAKARPDQAALATSAEARGATYRARPRSPSRTLTRAFSTDSTLSTHLTLTQRYRWKETDGKVCYLVRVHVDDLFERIT